MTMKVGESGKVFNYGTGFDLSAATDLSLKTFTPTGVEIIIDGSRISAPAVPSDADPDEGIFPANTYMQFTTTASDFTAGGEWGVCGTYINATPEPDEIYIGGKVAFTVEKGC
jgi:hypothetical protein